MSHSNPPGNGCSLEDCYTNLFALTDICGIKWKRLSADPEFASFDHLEDPVLQSYSKCIRSDILCVWRRVPKNSEQQRINDQLAYNKELWLFWYGEEPAILPTLLSSELKELECGGWDKGDSGISYECRTLLFKALHNLIERCLLTKGFVRVGRWFVQPYEPVQSTADRGTHLSFCFNFFLHGESSVCASIEVKQHPPLWRLTNQHLSLAQENPTNFQVILVPYGLAGNLTGNSYRETDQSACKILEEWGQFYPLEKHDGKDTDPNKVAALVEVVVAGVRMKYPSCYVLLCESEETPPRLQTAPIATNAVPRQASLLPNGPLTPPTSPPDASLLGADSGVKVMASVNYSGGPQTELNRELVNKTAGVFSTRITEKVVQDNCVTAGIAKRSMETVSEELAVGVWNFSDQTVKTTCNCSRHRANKNKANLANQTKCVNPALSKHQKVDKTDKLDRQQSRAGRSITPFHRRTPATDSMLQLDSAFMMTGSNSTSSGNFNSSGSSILPQLNNSTEGGVVGSGAESPSPADMSPLGEPQPMQNPSLDPTMPKLSPHPPVEANTVEKKSNSDSQTQNTVISNGPSDFAKPGEASTPKGAESVLSPLSTWGQQNEAKTASINSWIKSQQKQSDVNQGLKRPSLPTKDSTEEELVTKSLYDFEPVHSWCEFPVKRIRIDTKYCDLSPSQDTRQNTNNNNVSHKHQPQTPQQSMPDPYEFSEEASINPATVSTRTFRSSRDEMMYNRQSPYNKMEEDVKDPSRFGDAFSFREEKQTEGGSVTSPAETTNAAIASLTHANDLVPSYQDLDHLFESDEDNDDPFQGSGIITEKTMVEDSNKFRKLADSELTRMYPTPPSNNPSERSPGTSCHDVAMETIERPIKTEIFTSTLADDFFKDLPHVYKPPEQAEFPGSDKYSPVPLQSNRLSPTQCTPDYKASWQFPLTIIEKPQNTSYINIPSIENIPSSSSRMPSSAIESSPATFHQNSVGQQRTPLSYELQSPASNASSYLNKTLNSVDNQGTNHQIPEVHSLTVNIFLMDSRLNLFRDHNFDSCNICVCNMNIKGADIGIYMPDPTGNSEPQNRCVCGFSAIVNRRYAHNAGLYYEDEVDITGIRDDRYDHRKPSLLTLEYQKEAAKNVDLEDITQSVLELLIGQFTVPYPSSSSQQHLVRLGMLNMTAYTETPTVVDVLQLQDGNEVTYLALDQGRQAMEHCPPNKLDDPSMKGTCLHKWQYLHGTSRIPLNSQESIQVLKSLQPVLQDAIQNKRIWEHTYKLSGPLTWKEFHQLAGRGSDENSTPQPIPSLLVGHDRDWLSVSPYTLRFWDKQFLEPYSKPRDIAYVVLAPDNDHIINATIFFFKELSTVYELCRMGRHCPVSKKLRDGIMRVGKKSAENVSSSEEADEWFKYIGNSPVASKLRLYAQVCRHLLAPFLAQQNLDQSVFEPFNNHRPGYKQSEVKTEGSQSSDYSTFSVPTPQTNSSEDKDSSQNADTANSQKDSSFHDQDQDSSQVSPALMVYLIDPFTYGTDWDPHVERLTRVGLLKCYQQLVKNLPESLQQSVSLQIIPLNTILESTERGCNLHLLKSLSFSVFTTCRWNLSHTVLGRSLTGFGPAAAAESFLKKKEGDKMGPMKLYSPPFVLAPTKDKQMILAESCGEKLERSNVLFCAYCLSEDQRWLITACTDEWGVLMETCTINIEIPNRNRRKKASARKIGLQKLWDFILGVVATTPMPSRLVIGRFGRIGHGEMKGWSGLLSKKNLAAASKHVKEICSQCGINSGSEVPGILSACLVSMESHPSFHIMSDAVKIEEKMSSNCPLQTPRDTSTTHILVFPTSATAQANTHSQQPEMGEAIDIGPSNFELGGGNDDFFQELRADFQMDQDISLLEVFEEMTSSPNTGGPLGNTSNPGSPTGDTGRHSSSNMNGPSMGKNSQSTDPQDEAPNLLQQPLAMGYFLSTAKPGPLPKWFWSACPESEHHCPSCFKAALHIHSSSNHDEFYQSTQNRNSHPLDSNLTPDVLRYVLENYNALSWLTFDPAQNDRQSCLPIHFLVLLQMYHALNAFV